MACCAVPCPSAAPNMWVADTVGRGGWAQPLFSDQIHDRSGGANCWVEGFILSLTSGVGCAMAIVGGGVNPYVGVAISAALLVPSTNAGLCAGLGIAFLGFDSHIDDKDEYSLLMLWARNSFLLALLNIALITCAALPVLWSKRVTPARKTVLGLSGRARIPALKVPRRLMFPLAALASGSGGWWQGRSAAVGALDALDPHGFRRAFTTYDDGEHAEGQGHGHEESENETPRGSRHDGLNAVAGAELADDEERTLLRVSSS
jgi:hypothetical protein